MPWLIGLDGYAVINGGGGLIRSASAGVALARGIELERVRRVIRMLRLLRMVKIYKHMHIFTKGVVAQNSSKLMKRVNKYVVSSTSGSAKGEAILVEEDYDNDYDEHSSESHVGAAMSDLTNKRYVLLCLSCVLPLYFYLSRPSHLFLTESWV